MTTETEQKPASLADDTIAVRLHNLEERERGRETDVRDQRVLTNKVLQQLVEQVNLVRHELGLEPWRPETEGDGS